jgi:hypothetical protein
MLNEKIIGTWKLISYTMVLEKTQKLYHPYGENPLGFLVYTPTTVSVHIMRSDRFLRSTPLETKIEASENYGGYVGKYEIQGDSLIHYPEICGFIDFLKAPQIRKFQFLDDTLILECPSFSQEHGDKTHSKLVWQKLI